MSKEKLRVFDYRDEISIDELFDGRTFDEVQLRLRELAAQYEERILSEDCEVKFDVSHYGYDGGKDLYVDVYRWETDKEYKARMDADKKKRQKRVDAKAAKEAIERATYERLKKKFETQ